MSQAKYNITIASNPVLSLLKYIKYYSPAIVAVLLFVTYLQGAYFPTIFLLFFSLSIIIGDIFFKDSNVENFSYPFFLNLAMYINLPILLIVIIFISSIFSSNLQDWYVIGFKNMFNIDFHNLKLS